MPVSKKLSSSFILRQFLASFYLRFFLVVVLIFTGISTVVVQTQKRVIGLIHNDKRQINSDLEEKESALPQSNRSNSKLKANKLPKVAYNKNQQKDEWCEAKEYQDLSKDPVFGNFERWLHDYNRVICKLDDNCGNHDPRRISQFVKLGEKLSLERKKVFEKIIRGDPQKAILMALPRDLTESLPKSISNNLESWKSEKINLEAIHVCYDPNHPEGLIKHWANLEDGGRYRVWTYGKRRKMQNVKNIASWGVSLGQDFAMASHSYREIEMANGVNAIEFAGKILSYRNYFERNLFIEEIESAESRISIRRKTIGYPIIAGSSSLTEYFEKKYDLITDLSTWGDANSTAISLNGRLVSIESQREHEFILNQFRDVYGQDPSGAPVTLGWIGATDEDDQNSTIFDTATNTSTTIDLNASEGNWKWTNGGDVSESGYTKWQNGSEPININKNFAAIDWNSTEGLWIDVNSSYLLPFIVEYDLENEPVELSIPVNGFRKVLVVPARFQDEGWGFDGSSAPLTDQFGNPLYPELQKDAFEPVIRKTIPFYG